MSKRVTIKSIAKDLGISHMTVSRALTDNPNVQKETREAVRRHAQDVGYVRSAAAGTMRGNVSPIIGLLVPNIRNDFYARFANKLAEECEAAGLQLIIHLTKDDHQIERHCISRLREIQARAVITVPTPEPKELDQITDVGLDEIQLIRKRQTSPNTPAVLVDDALAIRDAVLHLHRTGHRRIAYLGAPVTLSSGRHRLDAYRSGLKQAGIVEDRRLVLTDSPSISMGNRLTRKILSETDASAIICAGFEISEGALKAAIQTETLNSRLAFVGYGDPDYYSWIGRGLCSIRVPVDELAECAISLVTSDKPREAEFKFAAKLIIRA
ncbi:LacI family DNA-binding transcriptional regulator [Falsihalocynthiibacter sp. SS001]|uniref:LacI family DNA-binding transcriptional regulator n=1 Tax=Falsihalocynthiibacter sp. SS001 TaxID=3349698 RepID=UPI0036D37711